MWVAASGDLDLVRLLHSRGVGLWAGAYKKKPLCASAPPWLSLGIHDSVKKEKEALREQDFIAIPQIPKDVVTMSRVLQYGWAMGAPLTPAIEEVFRAKRAATRSTILCFKAAARLSREVGISPRQRAALAVMGRMPIEMVETILMHADFETEHTLRRSRASDCSVEVKLPCSPLVVWMRDDIVQIEAFQRWAKGGLPVW